MKMSKTLQIFFLQILLFSINGIISAGQGTDTIRIDEVVISGTRIEVARANSPVTVSVINSELISSQEEANILPVVAKATPGLFVSEIGVGGYALGNETSGQITIRGVGGAPNARVMMLVDGQPQYMGLFGHPMPNFHMASNVERVEVVRGPASLLYGSNAMGGVINVISRQHQKEGVSLGGHASYGSFNTLKSGISAGYSKGGFTAGVRVNHNQTDGHRDTSSFTISNIHAYAGYKFNDNWSVRTGFTQAAYSFEDPGSDQNPAALAFMGDITRRMITLSVKNIYDYSQGGIYAFYNSGDHSFSDGWISNDVSKGVNVFQALDTWKGGSVTVGLDLKNYGGEGSSGFLADTFLKVNETAGYLVAEQSIGKVLRLSAGARYEHHSNFGGEMVPQLGITAKPMNGTTVKGLVSKGFRSPTIMEMYLFRPNAELGPERLWNYEVSVDQHLGQKGIFNGSVYMINGSNLIVLQPNPNPGPPMIRSNGGSFTNWGIELETSLHPVSDLRVDLNYSYLNTDTRLYFAPKHQFYAGAIYRIADFKLALNLKSVNGLYTIIDQEIPENDQMESYLLLDTKIAYQVRKELQIFMAGKNLLNNNYQTVYGYPMPGISLLGGISVRIN
jgi:outer membrane receptor protein involved in Fe transport